ncbi:MAG: replication protein [Treponemataceae bacterium]|nr:replication protein [Treponemataceae bacterium]
MANITKRKDERKRFLSWVCIIYPESAPANWKEIVGDLKIPWACSPLHDRDIRANGEPKKPHWHLLLSFRSVKTYEQVKEITDKLNAPSPEECRDTRGQVRYFLHLDDPDKAQYNRADIQAGGGFDIENALKASVTEEEGILDEMCEFIEVNWITEFCDFNSYVRKEKPNWRTILRKNCFYISQVIKSQRHKQREEQMRNS